MATVSFNTQDKASFEAAARAAGLSLSAWCRAHLRAACPTPAACGDGWFTIVKVEFDDSYWPDCLVIHARPDGMTGTVAFSLMNFGGLHPDYRAQLIFTKLLHAIGYPKIKFSTDEILGKRLFLPIKGPLRSSYGMSEFEQLLDEVK